MPSDEKHKLSHFIFDVDGVFTTGQFLYTEDGKFAKIFGPHDADGIKLIRPHLAVAAITADKRGYGITQKRIADDMGIDLALVIEEDRLDYMTSTYDLDKCIYMGDGMYDAVILQRAQYGIAPHNAFQTARAAADYVTEASGGNGAVAEACWHVMENLLSPTVTVSEVAESRRQV